MKVEVLYVPDCPFHPAAVQLVKHVLAAQGASADVHEILIADKDMADQLRFLGSPTIRVNGRDVADDSPQPPSVGLSCRFYPGSKQIGLPPAEMVHRAVLEALAGGAP